MQGCFVEELAPPIRAKCTYVYVRCQLGASTFLVQRDCMCTLPLVLFYVGQYETVLHCYNNNGMRAEVSAGSKAF